MTGAEYFKRLRFHPGERDYGVSTYGAMESAIAAAISVSIPASGIMVFLLNVLANRLQDNLIVSIPASGIMVFLQAVMFGLGKVFGLFPSRRAGLWCFYEVANAQGSSLGLSWHFRFHPGERDYGVSTNGVCQELSGGGVYQIVSIPASGIMVFLQGPTGAGSRFCPSGFPSRRAGLWCFYRHI